MQTQVSQCGNSVGIRIPKAVSKMLGIVANSKVEMTLKDNCLMITPLHDTLFKKMGTKINLSEMVKKVKAANLPRWAEDEPIGLEVW